MKAKKKIGVYALIWAVVLALFNLILFVSPDEAAGMNKFGGAFWVGYVFITVAFVGQLVCAFFALREENKKLFYRIPQISVSYAGLIAMLVFGTLAMAIPDLPNWVGVIVCAVVLAFEVIALLKATAAAGIVSGIDEKVAAGTSFIKTMTVDAQNLMNRATGDEVKTSCKKVYEAFRYSDPVSGGILTELETRIKEEFDALTDAVLSEKANDVNVITAELLALISERNNKCKLAK